MCEQYQAAVHRKDVAAFMALYDPGIVLYDAWDSWQHVGAAAWRRMVEAWFGSLGEDQVRVAFSDPVATEAPGLATLFAIVSYARVTAAGDTLRALRNRLTWVLAERDGQWRILHEHTSLPVTFEGKQAILAP